MGFHQLLVLYCSLTFCRQHDGNEPTVVRGTLLALGKASRKHPQSIMKSRTDQSEHVPGAVEVAPVETSLRHDSAKDEVLCKIGRNLMLFQQMEGLLKTIVGIGTNSGYCNEFRQLQKERLAAVSKKTMGQLIGEVVQTHFTDEVPNYEKPQDLSEAWVSFRYQVGADPAFHERRKKALDDIVTERNELVHHLLPRWNIASLESTQEVAAYLDGQRYKALAEFEELRAMTKALESAVQALGTFLASDEFAARAECEWLRQSQLVTLLERILEQHADSDGCVLLNVAGELLRQQAPGDYAEMGKRYGFKSLKKLILEVGLFELIQKPTERGGTRISYRRKTP